MDGDRILAVMADVSAHQEQTRQLVRAMMTLTGETASGLAKAAGLTASTLNRFMHKPVRHTLSQRTMLALMTETFRRLKDRPAHMLDPAALAVLGPTIAVYERGIIDLAPDVKPALDAAKGNVASRRHAAPMESAVSELPVLLTTTSGVDISTQKFAQAPLTTPRPPFLDSDPGAFAILMPDQSMSPRFDAGDMLYVSPSRALEGDRLDVVVERKSGGCVIGSLVGISADAVRIATLQPRARQSIARDKTRGIYRVVGVQRLGG